MEPIKCIFSVLLNNNEQNKILNKYIELENKVKNNGNNNIELNENETKNYFIFSEGIKFEKCNIQFDERGNELLTNIVYSKNNKSLKIIFIIKKYEFVLQGESFFCFEAKYLRKYLEDEYKKKKFYLKININDNIKKLSIDNFFFCDYSKFEIVYNYNYKPVTLKELTKEYSYTNKKNIKASELNYEFANYIQLNEEDFNSFYYIDSIERQKFISNIDRFVGKNYNFIALCGPFGSGKTVTLLKMINDPLKRSYYINLWTIFNLEIDEIKNVLKYEYVKIIGEDLTEKNENDDIIKYIKQINSPKEIYNFISQIIISLNNMNENIYYLIIDQYSSKYDEKNQNMKKIKNEVKGTKVIMIICSSMNNYDVKENLTYSFTSSENQNNNKINYLYVGCLIRLNPLEKLLKSESIEFKKVLSEFGHLQFYYYKLKETLRENKDFERFVKDEEKIIKQELEIFYKDEEIKMKIELAKIIYYIKEKEIFLFNDLKDNLLKLPLKFLEIKTQKIPIFKLLRFVEKDNNFELRDKIKKYIQNGYNIMESEESSITNLMNKGICINEKEFSNLIKTNENRNYIYIFFLDGLFPYIIDIFSKIIFDENLSITRAFFSDLSAQTQGGIIEFYLLEHIKHNKYFFNIKIGQFESIEVFVPNGFFYQNYSFRKEDTIYDYSEKENIYLKNEEIKKEKIKIPKKNILIKQKQYTGKYYDFALLIYSKEKDGYFLVLFQVSKKKINNQILYKEEHEMALNRVKSNIEEDFDINIIGGYFSYIFTNFSENTNVISFCKQYNISYLEFSFEEMKFNSDIPFNINDCFITDKFPFHNYFSILPKDKSKFNKFLDNDDYNKIIQYKKLFTFIPIKNDIIKELKWIFKINNKSGTFNPNNDYAIFGFFNEIKDFSRKYCIWYNDKEKKIYYYENDKIKTFDKNFDFSDVNLENKEWILICSKYKYKFLTNDDVKKFHDKLVNLLKKLVK